MMLTKEECEEALESLSTPPYESSCGGCICGVSDCGDCPSNKANKVLNQLIDEYFEMLNKLKTGDLSDGYHTFNELYHHRAVLFSVIVNQNKDIAWKSKKHSDGTMYDGMFIVGIDTPQGQYSYHYDIEPYWNMFACKELDNAPEWDGHKPEDIDRLQSLNNNPPLKFDELKENMWVWDNKYKYYFECNPRISTDMAKCVWYESFWYNTGEGHDEFYEDYIEFEENRFYRKEVQE